jgi:predicted RNA-binding Zn ribbon-like protein
MTGGIELNLRRNTNLCMPRHMSVCPVAIQTRTPRAIGIIVRSELPARDGVAAQARALREWFRKFVYLHKGKPLQANVLSELGPLNQFLAARKSSGRSWRGNDLAHGLEQEGEHVSGLVWRPQRRWRSPDSLLLPIARAMADMICAEDFTYVKECEGAGCTLLFLDRTRGHARRWCSMAVCGIGRSRPRIGIACRMREDIPLSPPFLVNKRQSRRPLRA